tara:strand:- start:590 stop:958 length:369 start_codon:yes stop_codon:yes gene_type:complete
MATYSKHTLSPSPADGTGIKLAVDSGTFTTIHTTTTTATTLDEIWLYASNTDTTDRKITLKFGGTTDPDDFIEYTVTAEGGLQLVLPGLILAGKASTGLILLGGAAVADKVTVFGYVNRITA